MNENIGAKGGTNDRRKTLIIKNNKEKEELEQLEQEVQKKQLINLLTAVPFVISATVLKTLLNIDNKEEESRLILPKSSKEDIKKGRYIYQNDNNEMVEIEITTKDYIGKKIPSISHIENTLTNNVEISKDTVTQKEESALINDFTLPNQKIEAKKHSQGIISNKEEREKQQTKYIISTKKVKEQTKESTNYEEKQLEKLKNKKIVTEYEKMLKDVRSELRKVIFDYNVIVEHSKELYTKKEAEQLIEKLNLIIKKIEKLQNKIEISNIDKYDDNYLFVLIEEYLEEFKDKKVIEEIKDSPLYISIVDKIEELTEKKEILKDNVEHRKEALELDEKMFETLKEKYADFEQINAKLLKFQNDQDALLKEIELKISNATTVYEKVQYRIEGATKQSSNLLKALARQMMIPGARSARGALTMTALSLHTIRNLLHPKLSKKKYKVVKVEDYSKEIEQSLSSLENISELLNKTTKEIDRTIREFKKEYKEYFGIIKECDELLENLEQVQDEIKEKDYELNKIKDAQKLNLEKNNAKVKKLDENTL